MQMDTGQGDGLHGTTLRSMLSQYLFSPGSSASGSNAKGAAPSPATAPDVPSAALDPHHPAQEEESPFAALCRKLYQSPANSDAPTTGIVDTLRSRMTTFFFLRPVNKETYRHVIEFPLRCCVTVNC